MFRKLYRSCGVPLARSYKFVVVDPGHKTREFAASSFGSMMAWIDAINAAAADAAAHPPLDETARRRGSTSASHSTPPEAHLAPAPSQPGLSMASSALG
jgi:hypothetical protein